MRGERVTQGVKRCRFGDAGFLLRVLENVLRCPLGQMIAGRFTVHTALISGCGGFVVSVCAPPNAPIRRPRNKNTCRRRADPSTSLRTRAGEQVR